MTKKVKIYIKLSTVKYYKSQSLRLSVHTEDILHLKGVSLRIQDLTDDL